MKRRLFLFLAIVVSAALPLSAWADVELVQTADGTKFKFGMSTKFVPFSLSGLDLVDDGIDRLGARTGNFRSFISPDTSLGDQDWGILNYNNLTFTLERGPLRIHSNLELEVNLDANSVDQNGVNMERFALYYKFETIGTLAAGFDVHAFDPEGGLMYTDEHPGVWLVGGDDNVSWDVAWHHVLNCDRGGGLFSSNGSFCPTTLTGLEGAARPLVALSGAAPVVPPPGITASAFSGEAADLDSGQMSDLFLARVNINVADGTTISPMVGYYRRHVPQSGLLNDFSDPTGSMIAVFGTGVDNSRSDQFRPGAVIRSDAFDGWHLTFEGVGLLGKVKDVGAGFLGGIAPIQPGPFLLPTNTEDFDLSSFALFFEVAVDGDMLGLPSGLTPYLSIEYHSGDGDAFDGTYGGYVPVSNLSQALRKDGFKGQSIASFGPASLGANAEDGWGFDVTARGTGATLGTIVPDETLGVVDANADSAAFNNRGGKGGNPGFIKLAAGVGGKIDTNWEKHVGFKVLWYDKTEAIQAEAAQNCVANAVVNPGTGFACAAGDPRLMTRAGVGGTPSFNSAIATMKAAGADLDSSYMGLEFNANVGYNMNAFRIQPFFSVFIPGSIVENVNKAFLGGTGAGSIDSETAFTAGIEFSAAF